MNDPSRMAMGKARRTARFERYTEAARYAVFKARELIHTRGGTALEPEHLLWGLLLATPDAISIVAGRGAEKLQERLAPCIRGGGKIRRGMVPFSPRLRGVLARAEREADRYREYCVRPEHLLLGLSLGRTGHARRLMHRAGLRASRLRAHILASATEEGTATAVGR